MIPMEPLGRGKKEKGSKGDKPRCRLLNGDPATCRTCAYVGAVNGAMVPGTKVEVVCCRGTPPATFLWLVVDVEPFCGRYARSEGEAEAGEVRRVKVVALAEPPTHGFPASSNREDDEIPPPESDGMVVAFEPPKDFAASDVFRPPKGFDMGTPVVFTPENVDLGSVSLSLRPEDPPP